MRKTRTRPATPWFWIVLVLAIVGFFAPTARAGVSPEYLRQERERINQDYDQGKFAEAKDGYEKLIESGYGSANVYYNLGNTDFRLGAAGRAMLDYERALALSPRHPEAQANLKLLRQQSAAKLRPVSWSETVANLLPADVWSIVAAVAAWLALLSIVVIFANRQRENVGWGVLALLSVVVCAAAVVSLRSVARDQNRGIITAQQTEARLAPAESAGVAEALPAGSQVRILSERGAWIYCELPGSGRGWIPEDAVERVRPSHT